VSGITLPCGRPSWNFESHPSCLCESYNLVLQFRCDRDNFADFSKLQATLSYSYGIKGFLCTTNFSLTSHQMSDQCAIGSDGQLKDASEIKWFNDIENDTAMLPPPPALKARHLQAPSMHLCSWETLAELLHLFLLGLAIQAGRQSQQKRSVQRQLARVSLALQPALFRQSDQLWWTLRTPCSEAHVHKC